MPSGKGVPTFLLLSSLAYTHLLGENLENVRVSPMARDEPIYWVYDAIEHLKTSGPLIGMVTSTRPMTRLELARVVARLSDQGMSPYDSWLLRRLKREFGRELISLGLPVNPEARMPILEIERGGDVLSLDNLYLYEDGYLRGDGERSELLSELDLRMGMEFRDRVAFYDRATLHAGNVGAEADTQPIVAPVGFEIFIEEAYIAFQLFDFDIDLGKERLKWGPGYYGNLLLSSTPIPLDVLTIGREWGPARLTFMTSYFERNKFLSAQRIGLKIFPWFLLGVSEAAVYSGRPSPQYLNPILPYYLSQRYFGQGEDNILGLLDFELLPLKGVRIYGEVLDDDYVFDPPDVPDKWGFLLGGHFRPLPLLPLSRVDSWVRLEYAQLRKWVYTHRSLANSYSFSDSIIIGHPIGPDADLWSSEVGFFFCPKVSTKTFFRVAHKGEGRVDEPWVRGRDDPNPPFPSGTVEVTSEAGLKLYLRPFEKLEVALGGTYLKLKNEENELNRDDEEERFQLQLFYHF